jgi:hypothetical protein
MRWFLVFLSLMGTAHAAAPAVKPLNTWNLVIVSLDGSVQLFRQLTYNQCKFVSNRVLGKPATPQERAKERAETWKKVMGDEEWFEKHPGCSANDRKDKKPGCFDLPDVSPTATTFTNKSARTAECFQ